MVKNSIRFLLPALLLLLSVDLLSAQAWRGTGRLSGVVYDQNDQPVKGAEITLRLDLMPSEGPPSTVTNRKGRWSISGLAAGRWRLEVAAEGYSTANGWADVIQGTLAKPIPVTLRPLDEMSPAGWEGNPTTVITWIERGNSFLEQKRYEESRAEYEKALKVLPPDQKPEVLRTVARTHFLEGDQGGAVLALKRALVYGPSDPQSRQLFSAVMAGQGKEAEAGEWLRRLDEEGPGFAAEELGEEAPASNAAALARVQEILAQPADPPAAHRVGRYRTAFTERSPYSSVETFAEIYGLTLEEIGTVDPARGRYELAEESFEVFVPDGYDPQKPYGLLVWISPGPLGGIQMEDIKAVLQEHGLIWIGANRSGNSRPKWTRMGLALDGAHNMAKLYNIDPRRVYVSGYSGGGRTASAVATHYSQVFQGAFCVYGVDYYRAVPVPDKPGAHWPGAFPPPSKALLGELRQESRFVLLTGERDFNRAQTKVFYNELRKEGFEHVTYLEIPGATHYTRVEGPWFEKAITALDAPLQGDRSGR